MTPEPGLGNCMHGGLLTDAQNTTDDVMHVRVKDKFIFDIEFNMLLKYSNIQYANGKWIENLKDKTPFLISQKFVLIINELEINLICKLI